MSTLASCHLTRTSRPVPIVLPCLLPCSPADVEFVEPNFKFRLAQRAIPLNMERATATGDLMSEGASGEAAVDKAAGGCSNATGACNGDSGNSSIFETRPHDSYWWDSFGRTLYHLDRVWAPKAWDTTTGSKQVSGSFAHQRAPAAAAPLRATRLAHARAHAWLRCCPGKSASPSVLPASHAAVRACLHGFPAGQGLRHRLGRSSHPRGPGSKHCWRMEPV